MAQIRFYDLGHERLDDLLRAAGDPEGASLLIPDLQRPYVWKPSDVIALVDSLLRGWPFGTLLLWSIGKIRDENDERIVPSRCFWRRVDRTGDPTSRRDVPRAGRGSEFRMVLDGQQRIQSLLLATQGDDSGFRLSDYEWLEDSGERPRANARRFWSSGQLCLDVDAFLAELVKPGESVMRVDYRRALAWVAYSTDGGGQSRDRPSGYQGPVAPYRAQQHIRFSRLWQIARDDQSSEERYREKLAPLLKEMELSEPKLAMLRARLAELVSVMGNLKGTEVSYLCVRACPRDADETEREQYDDAVVNIFTRLNTGGKRLTQQEVLFAWIKRKWNSELTSKRGADDCFEMLQTALAGEGIELSLDELVRGISSVWAALANQGILLTDKQFRRGADLSSVAPWMAQRWKRISRDVVDTAKLLGTLGLQQGRHYESLNSVYTFWAWRLLAYEWAAECASREMTKEALARAIDDQSRQIANRWMLIPQWAGRWQETGTFQGYVKELHALWKEGQQIRDAEQFLSIWLRRMEDWITSAKNDAMQFISEVHAERRNTVRRYYGLLWAWQNLDTERCRMAKINLTIKGNGALATDVDHIVSYHQWETEFAPALPPGVDLDELPDGANALGNCLLLVKNFNISKKARPLRELLGEVYEFKWKTEELEDFCKALAIDGVLLDATSHPLATVRAAVHARSQRIREDLLLFVQGDAEITHEDEAQSPRLGPWQGTWTIETIDEKANDARESATMTLLQDGDRLTGSYGDGASIEATIYHDVVEGIWSEKGDYGRFKWWLTDGGHSFDGTWGRRSRRRGRGSWRGRKVAGSGVTAASR